MLCSPKPCSVSTWIATALIVAFSSSRSRRSRSSRCQRARARSGAAEPNVRWVGTERPCSSSSTSCRAPAPRARRKPSISASIRETGMSSSAVSVTSNGRSMREEKQSGSAKQGRGSAARPSARSRSDWAAAPKRRRKPSRGSASASRMRWMPSTASASRRSRGQSNSASGSSPRRAGRSAASRQARTPACSWPPRASSQAPRGVGATPNEARKPSSASPVRSWPSSRASPPNSFRLAATSSNTPECSSTTDGVNCAAQPATCATARVSRASSRRSVARPVASAQAAATAMPGCTPAARARGLADSTNGRLSGPSLTASGRSTISAVAAAPACTRLTTSSGRSGR